MAGERSRRGFPWKALTVVVALVALDLWSKSAVFEWLGGPGDPAHVEGQRSDDHGHVRYPIVGEWLTLMPSLNKGAAFGRFQNVPHLLVGGRVAAVLLLLVLLWRTPRERWVLRSALVLVLAGALGNLHDNLFRASPDDAHPYGAVRDFIDVYFAVWDWHFPTFNVADSCISVGAVFLLLTGLQRAEEAADEGAPAAGAEAEQAA